MKKKFNKNQKRITHPAKLSNILGEDVYIPLLITVLKNVENF